MTTKERIVALQTSVEECESIIKEKDKQIIELKTRLEALAYEMTTASYERHLMINKLREIRREFEAIK